MPVTRLRATVRVAGRERSAFRFWGVVGFAGATALAAALTARHGLSLATQATVVVAAVATFYSLAVATKLVTGREALVYYHHEIGVLLVATATLAALGAPVAAHLDATALGLGVFLAFGRIGCLSVGCCHGRPAGGRGIRYSAAHARLGVPSHLVGVPLVPVQAIESAAVAAIVIAGSVAVLAGAAPGTALVIYVTAYAVLRFGLEMLRGDEGRRSSMGLTEAQWTSLVLLAVMAAAGALDRLPAGRGPELVAVAACLLVLVPLAVADARRGSGRVRRPRHVREIAQALERSFSEAGSVPSPGSTSEGVRLSWGRADGLLHYTVSGGTTGATMMAAELIRRLRHPSTPADVVRGRAGFAHLIVREP